MKALKSAVAILVVFLALCSSASAQTRPQQTLRSSCRKFVTNFYSWYLVNDPIDQKAAGDSALQDRSYLFSPAIVQALREDEQAQEKAGSDLVSLDMDPFAGPDGLAEGYKIEKIAIADGRCRAEVHGIRGGKEYETPDVIPELTIKNGTWLFVDFCFPSPSEPKGSSLLAMLKELRAGEKRQGSGSR